MKKLSRYFLSACLLSTAGSSTALADTETEQLRQQVHALKAQLDVLVKRLDQMAATQEQKHQAQKIPAGVDASVQTAAMPAPQTVASASASPATTPAAADRTVVSSNDKVKLAIYGQVNRAAVLYNNGHEKEVKHVDNNNTATRLRFTGEAKLNENIKAGGIIEYQVVSENSANVDIKQNMASAKADTFTDRILDAYLNTKVGKISLGQGETASHRTSHADLSGTTVVQEGIEVDTQAGGVRFAIGKENKPLPKKLYKRTLRVGDVTIDVLGSKRLDRVRYDTPEWAGLTFSVAHINHKRRDFGVRYAREWNKTKVAAALGWYVDPHAVRVGAWDQDRVHNLPKANLKKVTQLGGSLAVLFPVGISLSGGYAQEKNHVTTPEKRKNGHLWGTKLGYQDDFFAMGKTAFAVGYFRAKALYAGDANPSEASDLNTRTVQKNLRQRYAADNRNKAWVLGLYAVQNVSKLGMEIYFAWQRHKLTGTRLRGLTASQRKDISNYNINPKSATESVERYSFKPIDVYMLGTRIKF
ncbi:MAG: porin [Holosporales bacterium]